MLDFLGPVSELAVRTQPSSGKVGKVNRTVLSTHHCDIIWLLLRCDRNGYCTFHILNLKDILKEFYMNLCNDLALFEHVHVSSKDEI